MRQITVKSSQNYEKRFRNGLLSIYKFKFATKVKSMLAIFSLY